MPDDLPLYVETRGRAPDDGETFVLLHGYGASSFSWRTWAPALALRGHVVLVDLKGFGRAPRPDDDRYGPADQADLVHALVVRRDLRNVTLVGHSLGGGVALITALRLLDKEPERLRSLVVVAGAAYLQRMPPFVALARRPRVSRALLRLLGSRFIAREVLRSCVYDPTTVTREQVDGYAEPLRAPHAARGLIRTALRIVPSDLEALTARYSEIAVPTLLLWGRCDPVVPLGIGRRLARTLPHAALVVLDACGHVPAEERPEASLRVLEAFLDGRLPGFSRTLPPS
jgi:pimeloyl-ACP methyl ester carboxylesterase